MAEHTQCPPNTSDVVTSDVGLPTDADILVKRSFLSRTVLRAREKLEKM